MFVVAIAPKLPLQEVTLKLLVAGIFLLLLFDYGYVQRFARFCYSITKKIGEHG
jgi:hypothetical protein